MIRPPSGIIVTALRTPKHLDLAARRLQRLPEGPERDRRMLDVALRHVHSLYSLGRFRESVEILHPHAARLARLGDTSLAASYSFWLAHMYSGLGDQRRATESAQRAIEAATIANDQATLGKRTACWRSRATGRDRQPTGLSTARWLFVFSRRSWTSGGG